MKVNIYNRQLRYGVTAVIWVICFSLFSSGCMLFKKAHDTKEEKSFNEFKRQSAGSIDEEPKQLITVFQDMKQDEQVSWVWMSPGFEVTHCRIIDVTPVANYSAFSYPWAEAKMTSSLQKLFGSLKNKDQGSFDVEVKAAIIDMRPQKKLMSRLIPFEEDFVYIEMQLIIVDKGSQTILCKISHGKRSEDFKDAVSGMMKDVEQFFLRDVPKKPQ